MAWVSEAQSFRREDKGFLPLSGQRSVVISDFSAKEKRRGAKGEKDFATVRLDVLTTPARSAGAAASIAESR